MWSGISSSSDISLNDGKPMRNMKRTVLRKASRSQVPANRF